MFQFPFGTMHQLNLDWFLQEWENYKEEWATAEAGIDNALQGEIDRVEDAMTDLYNARDAAVQAKDDAQTAAGSALSDAGQAGADALKSEGFAVGEQDGTPVGAGSPYYQQNAKYYKVEAGTYRYLSEAYARGEMGGSPVAPGEAGYQDNAKYYKNEANSDALRAEGLAKGEQNGTPVASGSPYYQNNAKYYKEEAEAVAASIPQDYSDLVADVAEQSEKLENLESTIENAFDPSQLPNMADMAHASAGKYIDGSTGAINNRSGKYVTPYIAVNPGDVVWIGEPFNSTTYGTNLYDASKTRQSTLPRTLANDIFTVPTGIYYFRTTVEDVNVKITVSSPLQQNLITLVENAEKGVIANFYARRTLKAKGVDFNGYSHAAFPSMCYFAGKEVIAYRLSKSHLTPTDPENWGGLQMDALYPDGTIEHIKLFTNEDFTNLEGEIRDPQIQPSRDGNYLILATWTTYYDNSNNPVHDNLLVCIDTSFNVLNYAVTKNVDYILWGNPLITPDGHLLIGAYKAKSTAPYSIVKYYSNEVFNGDVSTLTFVESAFTGISGASEICFGYFNDKLVSVFRVDGGSARLNSTSNLEGTDGWGSPVTLPNQEHAPKLLPYAAGTYCPLMVARRVSSTLRTATFILLNETLTGYKDSGNIDPALSCFSAYLGFVSRGGYEYDVVYYEESTQPTSTLGASTALFWKRFNCKEVLSQGTYLL